MQQIVTLCDLCGEGSAAPASPVVASLDTKSRSRVVDLCEAHERELVGPLRATLEQYGRRFDDEQQPPTSKPMRELATAAVAPLPCFICDRTMRTRSGLTFHLEEKHGFTSPTDAYGNTTCPLCAESFASATGLGAHAKRHGEDGRDGTHGLYRAALDNGDPHDVIAKRLAALGIAERGPSAAGWRAA